jgi:hypothetical protein
MDEAFADDGALHNFWSFVVDVVDTGRPEPFDPAHLERVTDFAAAVEVFDALRVDP